MLYFALQGVLVFANCDWQVRSRVTLQKQAFVARWKRLLTCSIWLSVLTGGIKPRRGSPSWSGPPAEARTSRINGNMTPPPPLFLQGGGTGPVNLGFGWVFCLAAAICITAFFSQRVPEAWRRRIPRRLILKVWILNMNKILTLNYNQTAAWK